MIDDDLNCYLYITATLYTKIEQDKLTVCCRTNYKTKTFRLLPSGTEILGSNLYTIEQYANIAATDETSTVQPTQSTNIASYENKIICAKNKKFNFFSNSNIANSQVTDIPKNNHQMQPPQQQRCQTAPQRPFKPVIPQYTSLWRPSQQQPCQTAQQQPFKPVIPQYTILRRPSQQQPCQTAQQQQPCQTAPQRPFNPVIPQYTILRRPSQQSSCEPVMKHETIGQLKTNSDETPLHLNENINTQEVPTILQQAKRRTIKVPANLCKCVKLLALTDG